MTTCFICNDKLFRERRCVSSSVTQHSKVPYSEKIVELMGKEFVIIVKPCDYICIKCESLLNHMDKLENDVKLIKSTLLSLIYTKFGILTTVSPLNSIHVDNDHLKPDKELQVDQSKVSSRSKTAVIDKSIYVDNGHLKPDEELQVDQSKVSSRSKTAVIDKSIHVDNDHLIPDGKLQIDQNKVSSRYKQVKNQVPTTLQKKKSTYAVYRCAFCPYQSKQIGFARIHIQCHKKEITNKKLNQIVTEPPMIKKRKIASPTISPAETPIKTEENHNTLLGIEDGGHEDNPPMDTDTFLLRNYLSTNEIENMTLPSLEIIGNVNSELNFTENDENASGFDQEIFNIDIKSLLFAPHED